MPDPGHASLWVSWVGHLRGCNSHGGSASGRASEACGCPFAGRDRHGDPLHTDQCFWRLLLALCAIATPEAVLGEWVAMLLRQWIEPQAPSVSCGGAPAASCIALGRAAANAFSVRPFLRVARVVKCNRICPNGKVQLLHLVKVARVVARRQCCGRVVRDDSVRTALPQCHCAQRLCGKDIRRHAGEGVDSPAPAAPRERESACSDH